MPIMVPNAPVRDAVTGEFNTALVGEQIQIIDGLVTTPTASPIQDGASDPIPGSMLTVQAPGQLPTYWIDSEDPADLYMDWYHAGSGARGRVDFDAALRDAARAAQTAAEAAASAAASSESSAQALATGVVRSVNGTAPDGDGNVVVAGGGGGGALPVLLNETDPVPPGTVAGTLIGRSISTAPGVELAVVADSVTTYAAQTSNTATLAIPAGTTTGDLLVAVTVHQTNGVTWTPPAGWTLVEHLGNADVRSMSVFVRPVPSSPPSVDQAFTASGSSRVVAAMFRVVGADLATPVLVEGTIGARNGAAYDVPALVGAGGGLALSFTAGNGGGEPRPFSYSNALASFLELASSGDSAVTRTYLALASTAPVGDLAAHSVTPAVSLASLGSWVLAIRAAS